jgi:hypothetical protein
MPTPEGNGWEYLDQTGSDPYKRRALPNWKVSPTGEISQEYEGSWGGGTEWNPTGKNAITDNPMYSQLTGAGGAGAGLAAVAGGGGGGYAPSAEDNSAETAARTQSKENAGLRLQAGLKGLKNVMAGRGISKSGLFANQAEQLFAGSNAEEADTDREIIQQRAARSAQVSDRNFDANTQLQIASMNQAAAERGRIQNLLLQFGMRY